MSLLLLFRPQVNAAPSTSEPGGGGYGAVMSREFFERYTPRHETRYQPRYKPTLRKQKP